MTAAPLSCPLFVRNLWLVKLKIDRPIYFNFIQHFISRFWIISFLWKKTRLRFGSSYLAPFAILSAIYPHVVTLLGPFPLLPAAMARFAGAHAFAF